MMIQRISERSILVHLVKVSYCCLCYYYSYLIWFQGIGEASLIIITEKKPSFPILCSLDLFQNHDVLFPDFDFTIPAAGGP